MATVTPLPETRDAEDALSVPDAAERTLDAVRQLVQDRLDLARLELTRTLQRGFVAAAIGGAGALLLALAWIGAAVAATAALDRILDLDASVACVAAVHAALGGGLLMLARKRAGSSEESEQ
jgi:uncharacterized membrane protein YqjE